MDQALSVKDVFAKGKDSHPWDKFVLPNGAGTVFVATEFDVGLSDVLHYHDEPHLSMILNGGVLDKRRSVENETVSGGLMFFHAGEEHQTINKVFPNKYMSLSFNWQFLRRHSISEEKLEGVITKNPLSKFTLLKIYKEFLANDELSDTSIEMLLFNLIDETRLCTDSLPNWVQKVKQLLNDEWNREISLDYLSSVVSVHPKTISRQFSRYFACTLGEYRRHLKVEQAISMIKNSKLPLTEIAHQCDFADQSHFTRTFKDLTGFLPKAFQRV